MKKGFAFSALVLSTVFILTGCSEKEYTEAINKGNNALETRNFELAIAQFEKASKLEPENPDAKAKTAEAKSIYFDALLAQGEEAFRLATYTEAKELFEKAYALDNVKQPDLLEKKLKATDLEQKQKELNDYAKWVQNAAKLNNTLSSEWRNASSSLSIGVMKLPEFKEKMQIVLSTYHDLITSTESEILNISGELSTIHTTYLNKMQNNHEQIRFVILHAGNEAVNIEEVLAKGKDLDGIQEAHALHVQTLKSYAQSQGLVYKEK